MWGSFWKDGRWGYACCHSFVKLSYCIGKAGIEVDRELPSEVKWTAKKSEEGSEAGVASSSSMLIYSALLSYIFKM